MSLRGTYLNPPAAISACRRDGAQTPGELYSCAMRKMPHADDRWLRVARRLAEAQGSFGDAWPTCVKRKRNGTCLEWSDGWKGLRGAKRQRKRRR